MQTPPKAKPAGRKISTIIGVLVSLLLIPILIVNLTIIIKSFTSPERVPGFFGYKPLIVLSGSMEPAIYPGDIAVVKETPPASLQKGDVIAYLRGQTMITHRIMEIDNSGGARKIYTKGDNNNVDDALAVTDEMLEGKYLFRIPRVGHAAMFMQTTTGIIIFVAFPLLLFIIYDIFRRRYYDKREVTATRKLEEELAAMKQKLAEAEAGAETETEAEPEAKAETETEAEAETGADADAEVNESGQTLPNNEES